MDKFEAFEKYETYQFNDNSREARRNRPGPKKNKKDRRARQLMREIRDMDDGIDNQPPVEVPPSSSESTLNDFQKFHKECCNYGIEIQEYSYTTPDGMEWNGPAVFTNSDTDVLKHLSVETTTVDNDLGYIIIPSNNCDPNSVSYDVDPECDSDNSNYDIASEISVECIPWVHKGTEYILDEITQNVYKHYDSGLDEFIGKRINANDELSIDTNATEE